MTSDDVLSEILRELRFTGVLCCDGRFSSPWGLEGPGAEMPLFHFIREGHCYLTLGEDTHVLSQGDVVILPHGHGHRLHDNSGRRIMPIDGLLPERESAGLHRVFIGEGPSDLRSICGIFFVDTLMMLPLWSALPPVLHFQRDELTSHPWLEGMLAELSGMLDAATSGAEMMALKMCELVFLLALRRYFERPVSIDSRWISMLQEPRLRRVFHLIHAEFQQGWTLASLAKEVGMSRSLFAGSFKRHTGMSPMSYLSHVRMRRALQMMREGRLELKEIAVKVGFRSYVGFHNAFKRVYDCTPGTFRTRLQTPADV